MLPDIRTEPDGYLLTELRRIEARAQFIRAELARRASGTDDNSAP